ncbi:hypothetical protein [Streptomyces sp. NPDC057257]
MSHRLHAIVQNVLEGLRAGADVLLWGQAYPRTYPIQLKKR